MQVKRANTFLSRLKGLLGTQSIARSEGLLLEECRRVHTIGMQYKIAVFYLDENYIILGKEILKPNQIGIKIKNTMHVFETHSDLFMRFKIGENIEKIVRSESHG